MDGARSSLHCRPCPAPSRPRQRWTCPVRHDVAPALAEDLDGQARPRQVRARPEQPGPPHPAAGKPVAWRGMPARQPVGVRAQPADGCRSGTSAAFCPGSGRSPGRGRMKCVLAPVGAPRDEAHQARHRTPRSGFVPGADCRVMDRQQMGSQFVAPCGSCGADGARPGRCRHRCGAAGACFGYADADGTPRLPEVGRHPSPPDC